jgi:hypothetical protein
MKKYFKPLLFVLIGSLAGFAYYYYYGCTNGCPLTSTWYVTTVYGAMMGFVLAMPGKKDKNS